jgi:NAD(P) transhydrogenase subunit alpha
MRIATLDECRGRAGETRVALTPEAATLLLRDGHEALIESGAGDEAHFTDSRYVQVGARIALSAAEVYAQADVLCWVRPPDDEEIAQMREGTICIGLLDPLAHPERMVALAQRGVITYALELLPRIARTQSMDALTSMATIAGYKAVLIAADRLDKMCPLLMTAAGAITPATVLVLGAGVAGLQAIATAKRLGARVEVFDPRPAVREQAQSLGATFLELTPTENAETTGGYAREQSAAFLQRERAIIADRLPQADIVICTAQVQGKRAPVLVTGEMVRSMRPGAVLVDLAAAQGGNCELTIPDQESIINGVVIVGAGNLPALVPADASRLYARNVINLFRYLYPARGAALAGADDVLTGTCVSRGGQVIHEAVRAALAEQSRTMEGSAG